MSQPSAASAIILGQRFKSHSDFEVAWKKIEKEQRVTYNVINSLARDTLNKKCPNKSDEVPPQFKCKEVVTACQYYGKPRQHKHVEGKAKRPNQSTFKRDCLSKFNLNFSAAEQCYIVTKFEGQHRNHKLTDESLSDHYSKFRRPPSPVVTEANKLLNYEVKAHVIKGMVASSGIVALSQDIQNIRNKWKATLRGKESPLEALLKQSQELKEEDPNSIVALNYEPESYLLLTIFFQTSEMRAALETYPEVITRGTRPSILRVVAERYCEQFR